MDGTCEAEFITKASVFYFVFEFIRQEPCIDELCVTSIDGMAHVMTPTGHSIKRCVSLSLWRSVYYWNSQLYDGLVIDYICTSYMAWQSID